MLIHCDDHDSNEIMIPLLASVQAHEVEPLRTVHPSFQVGTLNILTHAHTFLHDL